MLQARMRTRCDVGRQLLRGARTAKQELLANAPILDWYTNVSSDIDTLQDDIEDRHLGSFLFEQIVGR